MKKLGKILLIGLGFGLVVIALSFLTSRPAPAQHPPRVVPVEVTNTPLPVAGNVNASQSGAWSVGVNNLPAVQSVSFSGAQPVSLTNTASAPLFIRDVDNPARAPVFGNCDLLNVSFDQSCNIVFATSSGPSGSFSVVPAGNRLVIESVSGELDLPTGTIPAHYGIRTTLGQPAFNNNTYTDVSFDPRFIATANGTDLWLINHQTRIYEDPGFNVVLSVSTNSTSYSAFVTVTGYLVSQ